MPDQSDRAATPPGLAAAGLALAVAAGAIVVTGVATRHGDYARATQLVEAEAIPTVRLVTVASPRQGASLTLPATVQAWVAAELYARVPGYVRSWSRDIGARVDAGTPLGQIDTPDLDQQIVQARADLVSAEAHAALAKTTAARWADLLTTRSVSQQEADEKAGDLAVKRAAVAAARASLGRLLALKQLATIRAPFTGTVTRRDADIGELVGPGATSQRALFEVADAGRVRIYANVPQASAAAIRPGIAASVAVPEHPGQTFPVSVLGVSEAIDPRSGTFQVQLMRDNRDNMLRPGGYAQVTFGLPAETGVVEVPASAVLFRSQGLRVGLVDAGGHVRLVAITIGRDLGNRLEVTSGVKAGDRVIDNPTDSLADGQLVRVSQRG